MGSWCLFTTEACQCLRFQVKLVLNAHVTFSLCHQKANPGGHCLRWQQPGSSTTIMTSTGPGCSWGSEPQSSHSPGGLRDVLGYQGAGEPQDHPMSLGHGAPWSYP